MKVQFNYCKTALPTSFVEGALYFVSPERKLYRAKSTTEVELFSADLTEDVTIVTEYIDENGEVITDSEVVEKLREEFLPEDVMRNSNEGEVIAATLIELEKTKLGEKEEYVISKALNDLNQRIDNIDITDQLADVTNNISNLKDRVWWLENSPSDDSIIVSGNRTGSIKIKNTNADGEYSIGLSPQNNINSIGANSFILNPHWRLSASGGYGDIILGPGNSTGRANIIINNADSSAYEQIAFKANTSGYTNTIIGYGDASGESNVCIGRSGLNDWSSGKNWVVSFNKLSDTTFSIDDTSISFKKGTKITFISYAYNITPHDNYYHTITSVDTVNNIYTVDKTIPDFTNTYWPNYRQVALINKPFISGNHSYSIGPNSIFGESSYTFGATNLINANHITAIGNNLFSNTKRQFVCGNYNSVSPNAFVVGVGIEGYNSQAAVRKNAIEASNEYVYILGVGDYNGKNAAVDGSNSISSAFKALQTNIENKAQSITEIKDHLEESEYVTATALADLHNKLSWNII